MDHIAFASIHAHHIPDSKATPYACYAHFSGEEPVTEYGKSPDEALAKICDVVQQHWLCSRSKVNQQLLRIKRLDIYEPAPIKVVVTAAEHFAKSLKLNKPQLGQFVVMCMIEGRPARIVAVETSDPEHREAAKFETA